MMTYGVRTVQSSHRALLSYHIMGGGVVELFTHTIFFLMGGGTPRYALAWRTRSRLCGGPTRVLSGLLAAVISIEGNRIPEAQNLRRHFIRLLLVLQPLDPRIPSEKIRVPVIDWETVILVVPSGAMPAFRLNNLREVVHIGPDPFWG